MSAHFISSATTSLCLALVCAAGADPSRPNIVLFTSDNGGLYHYWEARETDDPLLTPEGMAQIAARENKNPPATSKPKPRRVQK